MYIYKGVFIEEIEGKVEDGKGRGRRKKGRMRDGKRKNKL